MRVRGKGFKMEDLDFVKAPRENLGTWDGMKKLIVIVGGVAIVILALMALTLTS